MTIIEQIITVSMAVLATVLTRFLPFLIFPGNRQTPRFIQQLGTFLPGAIMAMLVVYCYKDLNFSTPSGYVPAIIAGLVTAGLHLWKNNMFLSIAVGTVLYMALIVWKIAD